MPELPLARPRAQGRLIEITIQDLRFTAAETATFLRQTMGLHLDERNVEVLTARTEGWVAGLQLAGLSLQGTEDIADAIGKLSGTNRYVADYFVEEVLEHQPPDVEAFLIETAFLYSAKGGKKRAAAAKRATADGPRTYATKAQPNAKIIDPKKRISTKSKNPLIVAVDVTGSMANWPSEIFDRLPLLFNTLSQYR